MTKFIGGLLILIFQTSAQAVESPSRDEVVRMVSTEAHHLFGQRRGDFLVPDQLIADAVLAPLGVPEPDGVTEVSANTFQVAGCRPHSCDEKAMSIADITNRKILVSGLRHFHCKREAMSSASRENSKMPVSCDRFPTITIFLYKYKRDKGAALSEAQLMDIVRAWAGSYDPRNEQIERIWPSRK